MDLNDLFMDLFGENLSLAFGDYALLGEYLLLPFGDEALDLPGDLLFGELSAEPIEDLT